MLVIFVLQAAVITPATSVFSLANIDYKWVPLLLLHG